jgi:hypothetical protein
MALPVIPPVTVPVAPVAARHNLAAAVIIDSRTAVIVAESGRTVIVAWSGKTASVGQNIAGGNRLSIGGSADIRRGNLATGERQTGKYRQNAK